MLEMINYFDCVSKFKLKWLAVYFSYAGEKLTRYRV